ncbi:type IV secretion system protein [Rhodanobacter sp. C01]|uniref:virB8 family protein n=1 Tax=Rhodanobacter sp. C01 TaxID=1945856 RepID=UPI0009879DD4|nr:type IV secretion system protein [Rhodanobacter sp. C01]OOG47811.1 conjugative transfer protein [Rhodanobacter sp. C01]
MADRKSSSRRVDETVGKSVNFELTIADIAKRSERRAWWVAFSAITMALILAGGYFFMLPLKQKVPYLVMADAYTGTSTVAQLTEDMSNRRISSSEAINRSNVAHFVMARESYDVAMLNLHDWATVQTMSSSGVKAAYTNLYSPQNPDSLYKTYGKDKAIRIKLLSIVLLGGGPGVTPKGATVRFQRSLYDKLTGVTHPMDNKIATMAFTYKTNLEMDDQSRIENPLGFWVTDYRVDNDYASSAPDEIQGTPLAPPGAQNPAQPAPDGPASAASSNAGLPLSNPIPPSPVPEQQPGGAGTAPAAPVARPAQAPGNSAIGVGHP